jgi:hypothetical protein
LYKERLGSGGDGFTASPVASEGKIYFASEQGTVYVVKPGADFTVLATNQMGEVCMATPAISEGTLFFRTQGHVVAVGFSLVVHQCTQFGPLWSNITAYLLIILGVHVAYLWLRKILAEQLAKKDLFGRGEFYLGMVAGFVRFACMLVVGMALMNSRVATAAELAESEKFQAAWFSDIRFPTYGEFQQDVLFKSCAGIWVESNLKTVLIASETSALSPKSESIAQKSNKIIEEIVGQPVKK